MEDFISVVKYSPRFLAVGDSNDDQSYKSQALHINILGKLLILVIWVDKKTGWISPSSVVYVPEPIRAI